MKTEQRVPGLLVPYENNNRKHPKKQLDALAASIREFWFVQPVVITPDGTIVVGHARVLAAQAVGLETVPCVVIDVPESESARLRLIDNRLSDLGEYDVEAIVWELKDLDSPDLWAAFAEIVGMALPETEAVPGVGDSEVRNMVFVCTEAQKETVYHALNVANSHVPDCTEGEYSGAAAAFVASKYLARRNAAA